MKVVHFKKIAVETNHRAMKAITHVIRSQTQRKGSWCTHHMPGYNSYDVGLKKSHCQHFWTSLSRNSYQDGEGGESLMTRVLWTGKAYWFGVYEEFESQQWQNMLHIWTTPSQRCTGTKLITSDNGIIRIVCTATAHRSLRHSWRPHKASLYWPRNKQSKNDSPCPSRPIRKEKKETSTYIRA